MLDLEKCKDNLGFLDKYFGVLSINYCKSDGLRDVDFIYKGGTETELISNDYSICIHHNSLYEVAVLYSICCYANEMCECSVGSSLMLDIYKRIINNSEIMCKVKECCKF